MGLSKYTKSDIWYFNRESGKSSVDQRISPVFQDSLSPDKIGVISPTRLSKLKPPNFPRGIGFASYDLSFFNCDWAGEGTTYKASDLALKNNGILMTSRKNIKKLKEISGNNYSLIFDPEVNFLGYVLLSKEK